MTNSTNDAQPFHSEERSDEESALGSFKEKQIPRADHSKVFK
jgi:hypothetical protein